MLFCRDIVILWFLWGYIVREEVPVITGVLMVVAVGSHCNELLFNSLDEQRQHFS